MTVPILIIKGVIKMIGIDFSFNNHFLSDFNMKMFSTKDGQEFIGRTFDKAEITSVRPVSNHYASKYEDVLVFNMLILKHSQNFVNQKDYKMSDEEIHILRSWLENPKLPAEFHPILKNETMSVYYYGIFTNIQPFLIENDCYGLYLTFTCNAPYGFSEEYTYEVSIQSIDTEVEHSVINTEGNEFAELLKPIITINSNNVFIEDEEITFTNEISLESMTVKMPVGISSVIIDCQNKRILDENNQLISMEDIGLTVPVVDYYNFISAESYLINWLSLYAGNNIIKIDVTNAETVSSILFETRYIIKTGGLS